MYVGKNYQPHSRFGYRAVLSVCESHFFANIFVRYKDSTLQQVVSILIDSGNFDIATAFPNVAAVVNVLPVTTATVERSFSTMKLIKTRLRSRLGEDALEHTMRIEDPDQLSDDFLESVIDHYKHVKKRKLAL